MSARELKAIEVHGLTRSAFILRGALAIGAAYGVGAVTPFVSSALGNAAGDDSVLSFVLGLEQLEAAFYKSSAGVKLSGQAQALAKSFGSQENEHVGTVGQLLNQLGGKPPAPPKAKFKVSNQASFVKLAVSLEDTGVAAYNGAIPLLRTPDLLAALGTIVNVEGRHSAALRALAGQDPAPRAFDTPLTASQVSAAVKKYGA